MKFHVPKMSCGHCTAAIGKQITALDASAKAAFDLDTRTLELQTTQAEEAVAQAIKAAGYDAQRV